MLFDSWRLNISTAINDVEDLSFGIQGKLKSPFIYHILVYKENLPISVTYDGPNIWKQRQV